MASSVNSPPLREASSATQTEVPPQVPSCPICHQTDQVRTIQAAFEMGVEDIAPPAMPTGSYNMMPWIATGFLLYLIGNIYLFVELGANALSTWPLSIQIISAAISLLVLLAALVLSYLAVLRVGRADSEATARYPTWDRAIAAWSRLYYCLRDKAVIDLQQQRVLSETELQSLLATDNQEPREEY